ncbi:MAG: hypothetical protein ACK5PU_01115 [bacterium]
MNRCSAIGRRGLGLGLGLLALTPISALAQNRAQPRALSTVAMVGDEHIRSMLADMVDHISEEEAADGEA